MTPNKAIIELKQTRAWKYLAKIHKSYSQNVIAFVNAIEPILGTIHVHFPYYTRHDAHHSFRVIRRMEQIVHKDCFVKSSKLAFTGDELFLLICAAYAHDLGMAVFPAEKNALLAELDLQDTSGWETNPKLSSHLRKYHSERGGQFISDNYEALQIPKNLTVPLHELMKAHNLAINELDAQFSHRSAAGEAEINLKQLACILCIGDALEFSETRVVEGVLNVLNSRLACEPTEEIIISFQENMKHICIGDSVAVGSDGKVIFSGSFTDPDILNLAHKTIDLIETWIRDYKDIDYSSIPARLIIRTDSVERNLKIFGFDFERLGIRIKKENIIALISSNATWTADKAIVLRELLQNSVEACRYRQFSSTLADKYEPKIEIVCDTKESTVKVIDNGCGMSRTVILNNFLTLGNSRSFDPSYAGNEYFSLARFGIGFWSIFTIADRAFVETSPFEYSIRGKNQSDRTGISFEVNINEFKDFTVFKPVKYCPGTTITMYLKKGFSIDDMLFRLPYHIAFSTVPITIIKDGESYNFPRTLTLPSFDKIFGAKKRAAVDLGVLEFFNEYNDDNIDFRMVILYRRENGKITFRIASNGQLIKDFNHTASAHHRSISICGFLCNHGVTNRSIDIEASCFYSANSKSPEGYSFTLNRLGLLNSPKVEAFDKKVNKLVYETYRKFLKSNNCYTAQEIYELNMIMKGTNNQVVNTRNALNEIAEFAPDLFCIKLHKFEKDKTFQNAGVEYLNYFELLEKNYSIWTTNEYWGSINSNKLPAEMYEFIKATQQLSDDSYFMEPGVHYSLLSENDSRLEIYVEHVFFSNRAFTIPISKYHTKSIQPLESKPWELGSVQGMHWAGIILIRKMVGANFTFIGTHIVIIKEGSLLESDFRELFTNNQQAKLCEIIKLLNEAIQGYIDDSIKRYM